MNRDDGTKTGPARPLRMLVVEDSARDAELAIREITQGGFDVKWRRVESATDMKAALDAEPWDLVISDYRMPHFDGLQALQVLQEKGIDIPFIIISGTIGEETAVAAMRAGAHDYLMKNSLARLAPAVERELRDAATRRAQKRAEEALMISLSRQEALLAAVPDIIMEVDSHKKYTWANRAGLEFFGEGVIGKEAAFYFDGEQKTYAIVEPLFDGDEQVFYVESWQRRRDGQKRLLAWWCRTLKDAQGVVTGALSTARDITESKLAEKALEESARAKSELVEKLSEAQKLAQLGHWTWDVKTGDVEWSEEVYKIFRLDPKVFTPHIDSILALSPWAEDHERDKELIRRAMESHEKGAYEQRFLRPDKSIGYYHSTFQGKYDERGNLVSIVGTVQDITERRRAEEELRQVLVGAHCILWRALVNEQPDGTMRWDLRISNEEAAESILPHLKGSGENYSAAWHSQTLPEDLKRIHKTAADALRAGQPAYSQDFRCRTANGEIRWISEDATVQRLGAGRWMVIGVSMDITERKRGEEALRQSEERFSTVFRSSPMAIAITRLKDGKLLDVNPAWQKMTGCAREEVVGRTPSELKMWADPGERDQFIGMLREQGTVQGYEFRLRRRSGEIVYGLMAAEAIHVDDQECMLSMAVDITGRKQAEMLLQESRARYEAIFEATGTATLLVEEDGTILMANAECLPTTGYSPQELLGTKWPKYVAPDSLEIMLKYHNVRREDSGKAPRKYEVSLVNKKGETRNAVLDIALIPGTKRSVVSMLDITERKQTEDVLAFLAQHGGAPEGAGFFEALARYLAEKLAMDFVCIDRLEGDGLTAQTVAVWCDGKFEDNVAYALKDTPCGDVVGKNVCCFPASVCQYFPRDTVLKDLKAESYVGVTLWSHTGQPIGLIAVIGRKVLANRSLAETILKTVAVRAGAEMERLAVEIALRESEEKYRLLIDNAQFPIVVVSVADARVLFINEHASRMFGVPAPEAVGLRASTFWCRKKDLHQYITLVRREGTIKNFEAELQSKSGVKMIVMISSNLIEFAGRKADFTVFQDITERKKTEEKIKSQLEELQRWQDVMLGREDRVQELKREVNEVLTRLGEKPKYGAGGGEEWEVNSK